MQIDPRFAISRAEAIRLVPALVRLMDNQFGSGSNWEEVNDIEVQARRGQKIIIAHRDWNGKANTVTYYRGRITSTTRDWRNEDGPVIRVAVGGLSWRQDGSGDHFLPEPK